MAYAGLVKRAKSHFENCNNGPEETPVQGDCSYILTPRATGAAHPSPARPECKKIFDLISKQYYLFSYRSRIGCTSQHHRASKTSYRQISLSLKAVILGVITIVSLWNLTGTSGAILSNIRAIWKVQIRISISRLRDFTRSCGKTSNRFVNKGQEWELITRTPIS